MPPSTATCAPVRQKRRAVTTIASDPAITAAEAADLMRHPVLRVCRLLASNPGCPPEHFSMLATTHPARVLRNPAFRMLCEFQPGFIRSLGPVALMGLLGEASATPEFVSMCARTLDEMEILWMTGPLLAQHLHRSPHVADHLRAAAAGCYCCWQSVMTSAAAGSSCDDWRHLDPSAQLATAWGHPCCSETSVEDHVLVGAMARHRLFSGSCRTTMHAIALCDPVIALAVLRNHPRLTPACAEILLARIGPNSTREGLLWSGTLAPPHPFYMNNRERCYVEWRKRRSHSIRPDASDTPPAPAWDVLETAILALQPNPAGELPRFLLLSGVRCPAVLVADAARRGRWPMRLAAALNPNLHPSIRAQLASADPNVHVRANARRTPPSPPRSAKPIPASLLIERYMPSAQRRQLARIRRVTRRDPCSAATQAALAHAADDPVLSRHLLNGVYTEAERTSVHFRSGIHRFAEAAFADWLGQWLIRRRSDCPSAKEEQ